MRPAGPFSHQNSGDPHGSRGGSVDNPDPILGAFLENQSSLVAPVGNLAVHSLEADIQNLQLVVLT